MSTSQHLGPPLLVARPVVVWILLSVFHTAPILPANH
jgi:hypothetical protein